MPQDLINCGKRRKLKALIPRVVVFVNDPSSILKLVSFESLAGNDFSERGTQAEAHCERNLNRQL